MATFHKIEKMLRATEILFTNKTGTYKVTTIALRRGSAQTSACVVHLSMPALVILRALAIAGIDKIFDLPQLFFEIEEAIVAFMRYGCV